MTSATAKRDAPAEARGATLPNGVAVRGEYFLGVEGARSFTAEQALAFAGLLEAGRRLMRDLESELECAHGVSLSALGLLGRLAAAPGRTLRLTELARDMGLSLSRVSRIVDALEGRGLIERRRCVADARAIDAYLTRAGAALARRAQATHRAGVERHFFARLDAERVTALAEICATLLEGARPGCPGESVESGCVDQPDCVEESGCL